VSLEGPFVQTIWKHTEAASGNLLTYYGDAQETASALRLGVSVAKWCWLRKGAVPNFSLQPSALQKAGGSGIPPWKSNT